MSVSASRSSRASTENRPAVDRPPRASSASTPRPPRKEAVMKVSNRITRLVLIALAVLALAAPVASARPAAPDAAPADRVVVEPEAPVVQSVDTGFDWGSAAIGAGFAGGIILLIAWGGITYRHRHEHIGVAH